MFEYQRESQVQKCDRHWPDRHERVRSHMGRDDLRDAEYPKRLAHPGRVFDELLELRQAACQRRPRLAFHHRRVAMERRRTGRLCPKRHKPHLPRHVSTRLGQRVRLGRLQARQVLVGGWRPVDQEKWRTHRLEFERQEAQEDAHHAFARLRPGLFASTTLA